MPRRVKFSEPGIPIAEEDLSRFEIACRVKLPLQYRVFLLEYDGGGLDERNSWLKFQKQEKQCSACIKYLYSISDPSCPEYELKRRYSEFRERIPKGTMSIGHDGFGNQILLKVSGRERGKVFFWDHEDEGFDEPPDYHNVHLIANSFDEFINLLGSESSHGS